MQAMQQPRARAQLLLEVTQQPPLQLQQVLLCDNLTLQCQHHESQILVHTNTDVMHSIASTLKQQALRCTQQWVSSDASG